MKCPYYRKLSVEDFPYGLEGYCEGDRLQRVRVPSLFEETHYCTTLQYPTCRVFQARQASSEPADTREASQGEANHRPRRTDDGT